MKKITLIILLFSSIICSAQKNEKIILPIDSATNFVSYQEVIKVDGPSKDDLYVRAREWFAKTYKSSQDVIQMDDKSAGKIIGKGSSIGYYNILLTPMEYYLNYTISVTTKDGRYRYEISPFIIKSTPSKYSAGYSTPAEGHYEIYKKGKGSGYGVAKKVVPHINEIATELITSLKIAMEQPAKGLKSKDEF